MGNQNLHIHSRVYTDTFKNKPYSMSMRENIEVTTPELTEHSSEYSDYHKDVMNRYHTRINKEKEKEKVK